jgi:hypothetical protein
VLPDLRPERRLRLDLPGTGLATVGLLLLCFGLIEGPSLGWSRVSGALVAAAAVLLAFGWWQASRRNPAPLIPGRVFADRNYRLLTAVLAAISFGMLGLLLPLVIYLQSVLSLSAVGAGLILWAGGIALVLSASRPFSSLTQLVIGLVVAGLGLGLTFAPLQSIAMRNVAAGMAGAAAGVMNTARQLGALLGAVAMGTVLQLQLATHLGESARRNAEALPESFRPDFLDGFARAAQAKGLEVGVGQSGGHLPDDIPASVLPAVEQVALKTFQEAFPPTMRATLVLPLVVLVLAVIGALFVRPPEPD